MRFVETLAVGWQGPPCLTAATCRPHEHTAQQIRMRNRLRKRRLGCHAGGCRCGNDALAGCAMMSCLPCLPPNFTRTRSRCRADTEPLLHLWQDTAAGVEPQLAACQVCRHLRVGRKQGDVARSCSLVMDKTSESETSNVVSPRASLAARAPRAPFTEMDKVKRLRTGGSRDKVPVQCAPPVAGVLPVKCVPAPPVNERAPTFSRICDLSVLIPRVRCLIRDHRSVAVRRNACAKKRHKT
jgi:hypothetical protein